MQIRCIINPQSDTLKAIRGDGTLLYFDQWQVRLLHYRVNTKLLRRLHAKWKCEEKPLMTIVTGAIFLLSETHTPNDFETHQEDISKYRNHQREWPQDDPNEKQ